MKNFEDNAEVIVNVTGKLEENSEYKTSESRAAWVYQTVAIANITGQLQVMFEYVQ